MKNNHHTVRNARRTHINKRTYVSRLPNSSSSSHLLSLSTPLRYEAKQGGRHHTSSSFTRKTTTQRVTHRVPSSLSRRHLTTTQFTEGSKSSDSPLTQTSQHMFSEPPIIPPVDSTSSFFHRAVSAIYNTSDIDQKLDMIESSIDMLKSNAIPLMTWNNDKEMYSYLHYGTTNGQMPPPSHVRSIQPTIVPKEKVTEMRSFIWGDHPRGWVYPARPARPELSFRVFSPKDLGVPLNAHIIHTLAHIELNAVEMYLDSAIRFGIFPPDVVDAHRLSPEQRTRVQAQDYLPFDKQPPFSPHGPLFPRVAQPRPRDDLQSDSRYPIYDDGYMLRNPQFIPDMLSIVQDEARHFKMCRQRLVEISEETGVDHTYGTQASTFQLWVLGVNTRTDVAERMAVIPLSQEARGLDATTRFVERLYGVNDKKSADIVITIGTEEEGHVAMGVKWLLYTAAARGVVPPSFAATYHQPIPHLDLLPDEQSDRVMQQQLTQHATNNKQQSSLDLEHALDHLPPPSQEEQDLATYWQDNIRSHFPDGLFPPFNRLARYASGMPETWYVPLTTKAVPLSFSSIPQSSPKESRLRKHFDDIISRMEPPFKL